MPKTVMENKSAPADKTYVNRTKVTGSPPKERAQKKSAENNL